MRSRRWRIIGERGIRRAVATSLLSLVMTAFVAPLAGATPVTPTDHVAISLNAPADSPVTGAPITLTDTLVGAGAAPQGTVTWLVSGPSPVPSCSTSTATSDGPDSAVAACTLTFAQAASYTVSANYAGTNFSDNSASITVAPQLTGYEVTDPTTSGDSFNECPAIGNDSGCALLIVLSSGGATVLTNPHLGPYDGKDDSLVGVVNETGEPVTSVNLSSTSNAIFDFDGDEICATGGDHEDSFENSGLLYGNWNGSNGCSYGPTGGEGPFTSFSNYSATNDFRTGVVNFTYPGGLPTGLSTYFSLESALSSATLNIIAPQVIRFTNTPPTNPFTGSTYTVSAAGGASGDPVTLSVDPSSTSGCTLDLSTDVVTLALPTGTCVIDANQAGNALYTVAAQASQTVTEVSAPVVVPPPPPPPPPPPKVLSVFASSSSVKAGASFTESASVTGTSAGDTASLTAVSFTYVGVGGTSYGPTANPPSGPGTYSVAPSGATVAIAPTNDQALYSGSYVYVAGTVTIAAPKVVKPPPPQPPAPPAQKIVTIVPFAEGSYALNAALKAEVSRLALLVKDGPYKVVHLVAYTDNVFTAAFDAQLTATRAATVSAQLTKDLKALGVSGVQIDVGTGITVTLALNNSTSSDRAANRRVVATLDAS